MEYWYKGQVTPSLRSLGTSNGTMNYWDKGQVASSLLEPLTYTGGELKRWNGSNWVLAKMKYSNESFWSWKQLKRWNGSSWVSVNNEGF